MRHRPVVYVKRQLGGKELSAPEVKDAVRRYQEHLGVRAVMQVLIEQEAWYQRASQSAKVAKEGMTGYYAAGAGALADAIETLEAMAEGREATGKAEK